MIHYQHRSLHGSSSCDQDYYRSCDTGKPLELVGDQKMDKHAVSKHQVSALLQARQHQYVVFAAMQQKQVLLTSDEHQMKLHCPQNYLHNT